TSTLREQCTVPGLEPPKLGGVASRNQENRVPSAPGLVLLS
ncbi:hypothetical protein A2U01_0078252, partial [Trifolium medium]|nr:hypothetical protein [Trifolium medium]